MYCNNCGKHNSESNKFCQYCGTKIIKESDDGQRDEQKEAIESEKTKFDLLWDKFAEVHDAVDKEKDRLHALSSPYIWELLERLSVNGFESFIQDNKDELNKQPYKAIEGLKKSFILSSSGGYRLWLAEALLDDKEELNKFKSFSLDKFVEKWKEYDFDKALKALSEEMGICITKYADFRLNSFMESVPEAKELTNATVEKIRTALLLVTLNGYHSGKIENTYRK